MELIKNIVKVVLNMISLIRQKNKKEIRMENTTNINNMDTLMNHLINVEGVWLHKNQNEKSVTSPYGIYHSAHPTTKMFDFIKSIATSIEIKTNLEDLSQVEIDSINETISSKHMDKIYDLAVDFYKKNTPDWVLTVPNRAVVAMFSMYTNGPALASKSLQRTLNNYIRKKWISSEILAVDGFCGNLTVSTLEKLNSVFIELEEDVSPNNSDLFEHMLLLNMSSLYANLVSADPDNYLWALKGWNNRLIYLSKI
jgi:hypothetical protein